MSIYSYSVIQNGTGVIQYISCDQGRGPVAFLRQSLHFAGLLALFFPVISLAQEQTTRFELQRVSVPIPESLLNSNPQESAKNDETTVRLQVVLIGEDGQIIHPSGFTRSSELDLPRGNFFPKIPAPFTPPQRSTADTPDPSGNTTGFLGNRLQNLQQKNRQARISPMILEGNTRVEDVNLTQRPPVDVTITITGHEGSALTIRPTTLTFTSANWDVGQPLTFTAASDPDEDDETITLTQTYSGPGISQAPVHSTVTIIDDERPVTLTPRTIEEGSVRSSTIPLWAALAPPSDDVIFTITGHEGTNLIPQETELIFPKDSWWKDQRLILGTKLDADLLDEYITLTFTASGGGYSGLKYTMEVTLWDRPPDEFLIPEGSSETTTYRLNGSKPSVNPIATITGHRGTDLEINPDMLIFDADTWHPCVVNRRGLPVKTQCSDGVPVTFFAHPDNDDVDDQIPLILAVTEPPEFRNVKYPIHIRIEDDDDPGLIVAPSNLRIYEGEAGKDFTVRLSDPPAGTVGSNDVTVAIPIPEGFLTASTSRLTFTSMDWDTEQTVTLTAVDDNDFSDASGKLWLTASGGGYDGERASIFIEIIDDDAPGLTVTPIPVEVTEEASATFLVELAARPHEDVTVTISMDDPGTDGESDLTLDRQTVTFVPADWNLPHQIKVTAKDDPDFDDESETLTLTASGGSYDGVSKTVPVHITDNDKNGLMIGERSVTVVEEGPSKTIQVRLKAQPSDEVTVTITASPGADGEQDLEFPMTLTFTSSDWDQDQNVSVRAVHDDDFLNEEEVLTLTPSAGPSETVTVTILDNDQPGLEVTPLALEVEEDGNPATFQVSLDGEPAEEVTVTITVDAGPDGEQDLNPVDPVSWTFTPEEWNREQTVSVAAVHDDDFADEQEILTLTASGGSTDEKTVTVRIKDNDEPALIVIPASVEVTEGESRTFKVELDGEPAEPVTVSISVDPGPDGELDLDPVEPVTITLTAGNWNRGETVTVTAKQDPDFNDESETLTLTASGGSVDEKTVPVTITDDDAPGLAVTPLAIEVPEEKTATFDVTITASPASRITLEISGHDGTDLDTPASDRRIPFSLGDSEWSQTRTVTVGAKHDDDFVDDGPEELTLTASGDFSGIETVQVTIRDNDEPGLQVTPAALTIREGASAAFTARLEAAPSGQVAVTISGYANTDLDTTASAPRTLTFNASDWDQAKPVTLWAMQDPDYDDESATLTLSAAGGGFDQTPEKTVRVRILDDDIPSVPTVTLSADPVRVDEGESVILTATVSEEMGANIVIPLTITEGTAEPDDYGGLISEAITIPEGRSAGTARIRTYEDDQDYEDETFTVAIDERGLSDAVIAVAPKTVEITILDDDQKPTVRLSASPNPVEEGEPVTITATLSAAAPAEEVVIPLTITAGTAEPEDYGSLKAETIIIAQGRSTGAVPIPTFEDERDYEDETFTVAVDERNLADPILTGIPKEVEITIKDDDAPLVTLEAAPNPVDEGRAVIITATITDDPGIPVVIPLTIIPGTAEPDDYGGITTSRISISGAGGGTVTILTTEDDTDYDDETFTVAIDESLLPTAVLAGNPKEVTIIIRDNDIPTVPTITLSASPNPVSEGESVEITATASENLTAGVLIALTITAGTAEPDDYGGLNSARITIDEGRSTGTVRLATFEDDLDYEDETFTVAIQESSLPAAVAAVDPKRVEIMILDDDQKPTVRLSASPNPVNEGEPVLITATLSAAAAAEVVLPLTITAGTAEPGDYGNLRTGSITIPDAQTTGTFTIATFEDDLEYEDETFTVAIDEGNLPAHVLAGTPKEVEIIITDDDELEALAISIHDAQSGEDEGSVQLPIVLNRATEQVVTVQYETLSEAAKFRAAVGEDYTASRGIVIFDPEATRGVVEIEILDDELLEADETFTVMLSNPRGAAIADGTGIGTIVDNDGSAKLRIDDPLVIEEEGMVQFRVSLSLAQRQMVSATYQTRDGTARAGEDYEAASGIVTLAPGTVEAWIAVPLLTDGLDWREETFMVHLLASEHAQIEKAVGVATIQESTTVSEAVLKAYTARFVRTASVQVMEALGQRFRADAEGASCGAAARAEMAQLWYTASSWDPSLGELLADCRISAASYHGFSMWGRGAFRQFNGQGENALTLRGEVTTGMLGTDYRWGSMERGSWVTGMLLAHSRGDGSFDVLQEAGDLTAGLTGIYPYVSYARTGWEIWISGGAGRGNAETRELKGDLNSRFGAAGMRGALAQADAGGIHYHGDILITDARIKEHGITADVYRIRAGLELNTRIAGTIHPYVEVNVRQDGGSAETGTGLEVGGGVRGTYPAWRLKAEVRTQGLVMHTADGFTEWGISGALQVGSGSEGMMMRLRPSWGRSPGMSMIRQQTILDAVPIRDAAHRTELELGYGVPWRKGFARSILSIAQLPQGMMYRLGGELRPWERLTLSAYTLAHVSRHHGRQSRPGNLGVNLRGALQY